jgi:low temperature requirement protein LtrA
MRKVDKLLTLLTSFGCDRWVHLTVCLVVSWLVATVANITWFIATSHYTERAIVGLIGVLGGILLAIGKEIYDYKTGDLFDKIDLSASLIGVALFYVVYCV